MFPVLAVDLFPTRYEAFEHPGVWCVFTPAEDGTFWHCRRDGARSNMRDFMAPKCTELAVYHDPETNRYAEVSARKSGVMVDCWRGKNGGDVRTYIMAPDVPEAIRLASEWFAAN